MDVKKSLKWASDELKQNNVSEALKSAEFLLRQILASSLCHSRGGGNLDIRAWMLANSDYKLNEKQEKKFREYIERRKKHEPVWYITGKIEFYGLDLEVNENVLIPRPETEFLVEEVLSVIPAKVGIHKNGMDPQVLARTTVQSGRKPEDDNTNTILELGTGSGAISLALANELNMKVFASDISEEALKVAKKNAKKLRLEEFIEFRQGDLLAPWRGEKFDIIVANLPYIPHEDMSSLSLDIHHWEPRIALDGGRDGLEIYEKLILQAKDYLNTNGMMFFEIGIDQGDKINKLVKKYLPNAKVKIKKDYGDIDRIAIISNIRNSC